MKNVFFIILVIFSFSSVPAFSQQDKVIKSIIQIGQTDNQTMNHLDVISNRFGGRLIGSDAYENAGLWCASQF